MLFYVSAQQEDKFSFSLKPCCCRFSRAGSIKDLCLVSTNISTDRKFQNKFSMSETGLAKTRVSVSGAENCVLTAEILIANL